MTSPKQQVAAALLSQIAKGNDPFGFDEQGKDEARVIQEYKDRGLLSGKNDSSHLGAFFSPYTVPKNLNDIRVRWCVILAFLRNVGKHTGIPKELSQPRRQGTEKFMAGILKLLEDTMRNFEEVDSVPRTYALARRGNKIELMWKPSWKNCPKVGKCFKRDKYKWTVVRRFTRREEMFLNRAMFLTADPRLILEILSTTLPKR